MIASILTIVRRYITLFGLIKFCAGLIIGFGVYFLPIIIAEKCLSVAELTALSAATDSQKFRRGTFARDLPASDAFHRG